jgi:hypothetical protein
MILTSSASPRSASFLANREANLAALEVVRAAAGLALAGGGDRARDEQ